MLLAPAAIGLAAARYVLPHVPMMLYIFIVNIFINIAIIVVYTFSNISFRPQLWYIYLHYGIVIGFWRVPLLVIFSCFKNKKIKSDLGISNNISYVLYIIYRPVFPL